MTDIRARLADALATHRLMNASCECCGEKAKYESHHQADVLLSLPGIAIVELPAETIVPTGWTENCLGAWPGPVGEDPVSAWPTNNYDCDAVAMPGGDWITIADARKLAAALLAAANAAERQDKPESAAPDYAGCSGACADLGDDQ